MQKHQLVRLIQWHFGEIRFRLTEIHSGGDDDDVCGEMKKNKRRRKRQGKKKKGPK
jgi:hypothetical protein